MMVLLPCDRPGRLAEACKLEVKSSASSEPERREFHRLQRGMGKFCKPVEPQKYAGSSE